jgi:hypothetical protein
MKITHSRLQMIIREELQAHFSSQELLMEINLDSILGAVNELPQVKVLKWTTPVGFIAAVAAGEPDHVAVVDAVGDYFEENTAVLELAATAFEVGAIGATSTIIGAPAGGLFTAGSSALSVTAAIGNFRKGEDLNGWFNLLGAAVPGVSGGAAFQLYKSMKNMIGPKTVILLKGAPDAFVKSINALVSTGLDLVKWMSDDDNVEELSDIIMVESEEDGDTLESDDIGDRLRATTKEVATGISQVKKALERAELYES